MEWEEDEDHIQCGSRHEHTLVLESATQCRHLKESICIITTHKYGCVTVYMCYIICNCKISV